MTACTISAGASAPSLPLILEGNIYINEEPAKIGTEIVAKLNDDVVGHTVVSSEGVYGDMPENKLYITASPGNYENIIFYVDGIEAQPGNMDIFKNANPGTMIEYDIYAIIDYSSQAAMELGPGWNLISVPYQLDDPDVGSVLENVDYDALICYNAKDATWQQVSTIEPLKGYWIHVSQDNQFVMKKNVGPKIPAVPASIKLYKGWNAIGYTDSKNILSAELTLASIDAFYTDVWGPWDCTNQTYECFGCNGETGVISGNLIGTDIFEMEAYQGYWICVTDDCTLNAIGW